MKPELANSRRRFSAAKLTDRVLLDVVYHVHLK